jgi:hypothetical protein
MLPVCVATTLAALAAVAIASAGAKGYACKKVHANGTLELKCEACNASAVCPYNSTAACEKVCHSHYACDEKTARCELSTGPHAHHLEECAHDCKPKPTHGYKCNPTAHRCESVAGSHSTNLTLCEHECSKPPEPKPPNGYVCNPTLKTCERSTVRNGKHTYIWNSFQKALLVLPRQAWAQRKVTARVSFVNAGCPTGVQSHHQRVRGRVPPNISDASPTVSHVGIRVQCNSRRPHVRHR